MSTINVCKNCQQNISKYNKFCSRSCAAKFNNKNRSLESRKKQQKTIQNKFGTVFSKCPHCDANIQHPKNKTNKKTYCSKKCELDAKWEVTKNKIERGEITSYLSHRRYLSEKFGYRCSCCELESWNNKPITLQVDHIDGDPGNNYPSNLRLMCPNCHSQTDTYKGGNKNKLKQDYRSMLHREIYKRSKKKLEELVSSLE